MPCIYARPSAGCSLGPLFPLLKQMLYPAASAVAWSAKLERAVHVIQDWNLYYNLKLYHLQTPSLRGVVWQQFRGLAVGQPN